MNKWKAASNYVGQDYSEYYVIYSQNRDSGTLERSNFECITAALDPKMDTDDANENVITVRASHWACGWVEDIMIHESDIKALAHAEDIEAQIEAYPVYNDDHYYQLCHEEDREIWQTCLALREKVKLCAEANISVFAARSETLPDFISITP